MYLLLLLWSVIGIALGQSGYGPVTSIGSGDGPVAWAAYPNPDYKYYPKLGYYKYHYVSANWTTAKCICEIENAHLATINYFEEKYILEELIGLSPKSQSTWVWIGNNDRAKEGDWVTITGQPVATTGYKPGKYEGGKSQNCGFIKAESSADIEDYECSSELPFFCELESISATPLQCSAP